MSKPLTKPMKTSVKTTLFAGLGLIGLAGCTAIPTVDDPMYLRMTDIEARLIRIERVLDNESLIQLSAQLDDLRNETQLLRGEIETLQFQNDNAAERQQALYLDLDSRLQNLENSQATTSQQLSEAVRLSQEATQVAQTANAAVNTPPPVPIGSDQDNYNAAFDLIQSRQYGDAALAFQNFLQAFPQSPLADNAQYWLAETFYVQRQFAEALPEFQLVLDAYPQSAKLPDALLKIGYCNYELQNFAAARTALEQVSRQFPDTTAARLAVQRLERIIQENG